MDEKTIRETLLKGERVTLECKKAMTETRIDRTARADAGEAGAID